MSKSSLKRYSKSMYEVSGFLLVEDVWEKINGIRENKSVQETVLRLEQGKQGP